MLIPPYVPSLIIDWLSDDELKHIPGALNEGCVEIDPVVFSVVHARLDAILAEMTDTILRTARNPILYGAKNFTCTLMNPRAEVLSMHDCIPIPDGRIELSDLVQTVIKRRS